MARRVWGLPRGESNRHREKAQLRGAGAHGEALSRLSASGPRCRAPLVASFAAQRQRHTAWAARLRRQMPRRRQRDRDSSEDDLDLQLSPGPAPSAERDRDRDRGRRSSQRATVSRRRADYAEVDTQLLDEIESSEDERGDRGRAVRRKHRQVEPRGDRDAQGEAESEDMVSVLAQSQSSARRLPCPVCGELVRGDRINAHVDGCVEQPGGASEAGSEERRGDRPRDRPRDRQREGRETKRPRDRQGGQKQRVPRRRSPEREQFAQEVAEDEELLGFIDFGESDFSHSGNKERRAVAESDVSESGESFTLSPSPPRRRRSQSTRATAAAAAPPRQTDRHTERDRKRDRATAARRRD